MKRYYFKKSEKETERLKRDLSYYAQVMHYQFISDENDEGWACEIRVNKESDLCVAVVVRNSMSNAITIEMGITDWLDQDKLLPAYFPELLSEVKETNPGIFSNGPEKEIRHDVKVLAKVRLGSYFNTRKDIAEN